jgi:hypothetical protein
MKPTRYANSSAAAKNPVLWISVFLIALFAGLSVTRAQTAGNADVVTAISNLENDAVKADLAGDTAFYPGFAGVLLLLVLIIVIGSLRFSQARGFCITQMLG